MKMNVKKFANKKLVACAALIAAATTTAMAQGNGLAGINEATSMVTSYFEPGTKLIYAIGAVVGLIGIPTPQRLRPRGSVPVSSLSWPLPSCARSSSKPIYNKRYKEDNSE